MPDHVKSQRLQQAQERVRAHAERMMHNSQCKQASTTTETDDPLLQCITVMIMLNRFTFLTAPNKLAPSILKLLRNVVYSVLPASHGLSRSSTSLMRLSMLVREQMPPLAYYTTFYQQRRVKADNCVRQNKNNANTPSVVACIDWKE